MRIGLINRVVINYWDEGVLAKARAYVNSKNNKGQSPLQLAIDNGKKEIAALLVEKGADVNTPDGDGNFLIHKWAVDNDIKVESFETLVKSTSKENFSSLTPNHTFSHECCRYPYSYALSLSQASKRAAAN